MFQLCKIIQGSGWTAIAYAAVQNEYDVMSILLENEADIFIPSKVGIAQANIQHQWLKDVN